MDRFGWTISSIGAIFFIAITALLLLWGPLVGPWAQQRQGMANFNQAEQERRIAVEEAMAVSDAAEFLAQAEITRAHGVAEANRIVADGLGGPEGYLRYLFIQQLSANEQDVIYLPTEAGIPILEANRLRD